MIDILIFGAKLFLGLVYGLHIELPPQFVLVPPPPSARTTVGVTKVLRNRTAAPTTSSICFTVFSPCDCELDGDRFTPEPLVQRHGKTFNCSEFVTRCP